MVNPISAAMKSTHPVKYLQMDDGSATVGGNIEILSKIPSRNRKTVNTDKKKRKYTVNYRLNGQGSIKRPVQISAQFLRKSFHERPGPNMHPI